MEKIDKIHEKIKFKSFGKVAIGNKKKCDYNEEDDYTNSLDEEKGVFISKIINFSQQCHTNRNKHTNKQMHYLITAHKTLFQTQITLARFHISNYNFI